MAIDQSSAPRDLRPLNLNRTAAEDPPSASAAADGIFPSPHFRPVYYPVAAPDAGHGGLGFGNGNASSIAAWPPQPISAVNRPAADPVGGDDGAADDPRSRKVKFLCSFGGKILPRPSDGTLRYVGGQTRIISTRRDVGFQELVQKMAEMCGQSAAIKYQLPDEDLDALVSVSCPEDLENMMEEYEKLAENLSDGSAKLRVFLFSASDVESPGVVQFGDLSDSGQRYVEAVNGILDPTGGIRREKSVASMSSTQNSDGLMGGEAAESSHGGQADFPDGASPVVLSPTDVASSAGQDSGRLVFMPPSSAAFAEPVQLNLPPIATGRPRTISPSGSEPELDRSAPTAVPPLSVLNSHSSVVDYRPVTTYVHSYSDLNQDMFNRVDYPQNSSQIGYMNPQSLGPPRQFYKRPLENPQQVPSHQFVPMVHATVAPTSPRLSVKPIGGGQQFMPQHQKPYLEEGSIGARAVQLPADQSYKAFQSQAQPIGLLPAQAFEQYNWRAVPPVPPPEHVICTDARAPQPHQQGMLSVPPEKIPRSEECYMCHKGLPHAHSDSLLQEHGNPGIVKTISDTNAVLQSHHSDESVRSRLAQRVGLAGAEVPIEHQNERTLGVEATALGVHGAGIRPKFIGHIDPTVHEVAEPHLVAYGFSQVPESQHNERMLVQKTENPDYPRTLFSISTAGFPGDGQVSYGMFLGNLPQSPQEAMLQQLAPSSQYHVKQDTMVNKTVGADIPPTRSVPFQTSEPSLPGQNHAFVPKEDVSDVSCDHTRTIDGRMEALRISPPEISGIAEQYRLQNRHNMSFAKDVKPENVPPGVDSGIRVTEPITLSNANIAREEIPDKVAGKEMYTTNAFIMPGVILDGNYGGLTDPFPPSLAGSSLHNFQPEETNLVSQTMGNDGAYQPVRVGIDPSLPSEMWCDKPTFSYIDSTATPGEWKDEASRFHSRRVLNDMAPPANSNAPFSALNVGSANGLVTDSWDPSVQSNSLFSNRDPWKLRHDMHFPPPKVPKVASREILLPRDSNGENCSGSSGELGITTQMEEGLFHQQSEGLNKDSCSETGQSVKGSAEEQIKQELQAVAEGVAASVLQSSIPPMLTFSGRERNESSSEPNQDGVHQYEETENTVAKDIKNKYLDKTSPSLTPTADGINRLQIIKNSDLEELRELGSGTFGTVYHGKWRGTDVAIKRINDRCFAGKPSEQERMRDDFWNEACKLADLHHPNVVAFYGVVLDGPGGSVATVTEYMVNGSLRHALQRNDKTLDYRKRLLIAMDVAFGMEYLHGKNIVHFDLKSDNLLVNLRDPHRPICKVGDLGLSKVKCQTLISGGVRGTLPWMAPELLNGSSSLVSEKVDVFSFGIVMWELVTGEEPYADLHYGAIIGGIVSNKLRPPVSETCDPEWRSLMEKCWSSEPSERPSFTEIANKLRSMAASLPPKAQAQHHNP